MSKTTRKRISIALAAVCCLSLIVGSFAFFTDRAEANATGKAGNIDLEFIDVSAADQHAQTTQENTDSLVWTDSKITNAEQPIMNPGDNFDMGYKLKNEGSKSIDVRQVMTVTVTKKDGAAQTLTEDDLQYFMTNDAAGFKLDAQKSDLAAGKLVYIMDDIILNGSFETEDGIDYVEKEFDAYLTFAGSAKNEFMDSNVAVNLVVEAKQHRNTEAGWTVINEFETGNYVAA